MEDKETFYCRKCTSFLPEKNFYKAVDNGLIDTNGKLSVCKTCAQKIYDEIYAEKGSMEKAIHAMCTSLNIKFSNEALSATKSHINTLLENGKNVNAIFSIFLMKLVATNPSMDKSVTQNMTYEDVGVIFTTQEINTREIPIPVDTLKFWGETLSREDVEYLEGEYVNFRQSYKSEKYADVILMKQVCYILLDISEARKGGADTSKLGKELRELMDSLTISPESANKLSTGKEVESYGLWIQDIENYEPCEWLKSDPRGDIYRDVAKTEEYFKSYFVRPLKNFITGSKDFNVEDSESTDDEFVLDPEEAVDFRLVDDGED